MEELSDKQEEKVEMESSTLESINENGLSTEKPVDDENSSEQTNEQPESEECPVKTAECKQVFDESASPSNAKETVTGTKVKRKLRSTRRKLNSMINNTSLHFSDTDSEGELTTINSQVRTLNHTADDQQWPIICVTSDDTEAKGSNILSPDDDKGSPQRGNFVECLTDVDEIYPSEPETEQIENQNCLKVAENPCHGETDLEDFEGDDEVHWMIYVKPRSDIFCDYSGETVMTKEGDGPFSVEVRNKMYRDDSPLNRSCGTTPDIVVMSNTDEEDMDISDEEDVEEACCSHKELLEDLEVLAASHVVMKNMNKMENMLVVKDNDDAISDCHTDVEDVDPNE
ncbi:PREDICTED: uncharacterized protein LOC108578173 [Habropoda laboriosa]|uniref:uncharacterized protein LOC108578173 n=1 Tax=Habropoda laboriosa TaxID=597456 RepID=UPI00083CE042|nr:PREDICTED: uncharacterized protein LOC108578173 [Habropoda laboriosa]